MAETSKNNALGVSDDVSNLNNVDNEKPSCSSVNGTAVVKEQLVDSHVGLHVSELLCTSMEEEDFMTLSQDDMKDDESSDRPILIFYNRYRLFVHLCTR